MLVKMLFLILKFDSYWKVTQILMNENSVLNANANLINVVLELLVKQSKDDKYDCYSLCSLSSFLTSFSFTLLFIEVCSSSY